MPPHIRDFSFPSAAALAERKALAAKRRRRVLPWVAGAALVLGGVGVGGYLFVQAKFGGARTPEAAVATFTGSLEDEDLLALVGIMSPAEREALADVVSVAAPAGEGGNGAAARGLDLQRLSTDLLDHIDITMVDPEFSFEDAGPDYTVATMTSGRLEVTFDADAIESLIAGEAYAQSIDPDLSVEEYGLVIFGDDGLASIEQPLVLEGATRAEAADSYLPPPSIGIVREDGRWFVSPVLTFGELYLGAWAVAYDELHVDRGSFSAAADPLTSALTPAESVEYFLETAVDAVTSEDYLSQELIDSLALPERRLVAVYGPPAVELAGIASSDTRFDIWIDGVQLGEVIGGEDSAFVTVNHLTLQAAEYYGSEITDNTWLDLTSGCLTSSNYWWDGCLDGSDPAFGRSRTQVEVATVREDGVWRVSLLGSAAQMGRNLLEVEGETGSGRFNINEELTAFFNAQG